MYDLIIIGGGPAGLTAGIYAQRARLSTVLLEKQMVGGQIAVSDVIENFPGFPSISGAGLMEKFEEHARGPGLEIKFADVQNIAVEGGVKVLKTSEGEMRAKSVIIATGASPKRLRVPGEQGCHGRKGLYRAGRFLLRHLRRPVLQEPQGARRGPPRYCPKGSGISLPDSL